MPLAARTFRVFVSSTFDDLKEERNALQKDVFPNLEALCASHGARFQPIDLRWGVRDEAALDQRTMEICLAEIERCQKTGIKPNFIVLLGDRYGWQPLPSRIPATEFDPRPVAGDWYRLDENAVPPEYVLQPRTGIFTNPDIWSVVEQVLHARLEATARAARLPRRKRFKYEASATHQEICAGLGKKRSDRQHVFGFFRQPPLTIDARLEDLKAFLSRHLPAGNVVAFGISDTAALCAAVYTCLERVILAEVSGFESRTATELEIEAHDAFARDRVRHFVGRASVLAAIDYYRRCSDSRPFVVHGASGSGKSAVMAVASRGAGVIRRFIGVTPESSSGTTLLRGLCEQMGAQEVPLEFHLVVKTLEDRLALATAEQPITLFIDALDQLSDGDPAKSLTWLPPQLPPHCRIVVSTANVPPAIAETNHVELEALPPKEADDALSLLLRAAHRTLQPAQKAHLLASFGRCGLPLYLKLAVEEARRWRSFESIRKCTLGEGVPGIIDTLLNRLSENTNHGPVFVRRALGYLAAARYGLTESEVIDVLSADDPAWRDFRKRAKHQPPARRIPVTVWSRLFLELEPYLTERAAPGGTVVSYYHRQLAEQVTARFLTNSRAKARHAALAHYFGRQSHWLGELWRRPNARKAVELLFQALRAGLVAQAAAALTDLGFVASKCAAALVLDLQEDYIATIALCPEAQAEVEETCRRDESLARYARDLTAFAKGDTAHLEVPRSVAPWSEERISADVLRIHQGSECVDHLRLFLAFVNAESFPLQTFGARPGFVVQHAFNYAPLGRVHMSAVAALAEIEVPTFLRRWGASVSPPRRSSLKLTLSGHSWTVGCVDVTPNGKWVVSGGLDSTVRIWSMRTGECLHVLTGHEVGVHLVATAANDRAVSLDVGGTLRVWDLTSGACIRAIDGEPGWIEAMSVTADCRKVLLARDLTLALLDLETGERLRCPDGGHAGKITGASMTPDGRLALSASGDHTLRMWDLETGQCLCVMQGHTGDVTSAALTPSGSLAISGSMDKTVRVWAPLSGRCLRILDGPDPVTAVSLTADGQLAVSSGDDSALRLWDLSETGSSRPCRRVLRPPQDYRHSDQSPEWIHRWGLTLRASLLGFRGSPQSLAVTADGRRAVSVSGGARTIRVWDLESGNSTQPATSARSPVACLAMTPDGRRAVSAGADETLQVWDAMTSACIGKFKVDSESERYGQSITSLATLGDSRRAVSTVSLSHHLWVWDLETGAYHKIKGRTCLDYERLSTTRDGCRLITTRREADYGPGYRELDVWDLERKALWTLPGTSSVSIVAAILPAGNRAVCGYGDVVEGQAELKLIDVATGDCLQVLPGHKANVESLSVSSDGRQAMSASRDRTLRVWDLETAECLQVLAGHRGAVNVGHLAPDGAYALSGSCDGTLRLWEVGTGECLTVLFLGSSITSLAHATSPPLVVAGTSEGEVMMFEIRGPVRGTDRPR